MRIKNIQATQKDSPMSIPLAITITEISRKSTPGETSGPVRTRREPGMRTSARVTAAHVHTAMENKGEMAAQPGRHNYERRKVITHSQSKGTRSELRALGASRWVVGAPKLRPDANSRKDVGAVGSGIPSHPAAHLAATDSEMLENREDVRVVACAAT